MPPASTKSISTVRTSRIVTTVRPTSARCRPAKTGSPFPFGPANVSRVKRQKAKVRTPMLRAIVFDFDGVLANSEPLHFCAFRDVLAGERVTLTESDYYDRLLGYDDVGVFRELASDRGQPWSMEHIAALVTKKAARMEVLEADESVLFPGAETAVR